MDLVEEERAIQRQCIERGEFPTQEQHQASSTAWIRLIDYLVGVLQQDGMTLDDARLRMVRSEPCEEETEDFREHVGVLAEALRCCSHSYAAGGQEASG